MKNTIVNSVLNRINANADYTAQQQNINNTSSKDKCLVLITGQQSLNNNEINFLNHLKNNYSITFAVDFIAEHTSLKVDRLKQFTTAKFITESYFMESKVNLRSFDTIIGLDLNVTSLAKIYHGILDEVIPYIIWRGIENDIPIMINELNLLEEYSHENLKAKVQNYLDFLYQTGAKKMAEWESNQEIIPESSSEDSNYSYTVTDTIITTSNLKDFAANSRVRVPADAIITALATEIIKQKQLQITRRNEPNEIR